jgi:uncharacterized membrane protein YecN with MAPEG domain
MILPIALTIAAAAALINVWLAYRVGQVRRALKIYVGDGGDERLARRMRAHANFAENAPIALVLIAGVELATGDSLYLWAAGVIFILARVAHAFGMDRPGGNLLRTAGALLTALVLVALALWAAQIAYRSPPLHSSLEPTSIRTPSPR